MQDIKAMHSTGIAYEEAGGVTDESFPQYKELARKLLDKLKTKIPGLLQQEPYFAELFYE